MDLADRRSPNPKPNPKLVKVCPVDGVADEDGVEILRQNDSQDCQADLEWIAERVKGNALILTLLGSIGASSPGDLRKQPELVTEEAEPIIQAQLERQSEAAQELLKRMCVLRAGIDVQGLTFLRLYEPESKDERFEKAVQLGKPVEFTKAETRETKEIIKQLVNSSLVQHRYDQKRCKHFYDLHRLIVECLQAEYETDLSQLWEGAYKFYRTGKIIENPKTLEDLYPVLESRYFASQLGKHSEASNLLTQLRTPLGNLLDQADAYSSLGEIENRQGNFDEAERCYKEALVRFQELGMTLRIAETNYDFAQLWQKRGNPEKAQEYYTTAHQLYQKLGVVKDLERIEREWNLPE
ncbi:MAG: tetratricopeptide repeat protein [Desertifilum sp. SIO1I2]|nr:tetratricopeptide repeat protein [Desertifilum sp. SIO1I2]